MKSSIYLAIPLMAILAILQAAALPRFPIFGLIPQPMLLVVLAWELLNGIEEGIIWAFIAGFFLDLFSLSPVGFSSLALMGGILITGLIQQNLPANRVVLPIFLAVLVTFIYFFLYLLLLTITGYSVEWLSVNAFSPIALLHAFLILPIYWVIYSLNWLIKPRRVEI